MQEYLFPRPVVERFGRFQFPKYENLASDFPQITARVTPALSAWESYH